MRGFIYVFLIFCTGLLFCKVKDVISNAVVFSDIYETGAWGVDAEKKGHSGTGSDPRNAKMYIAFLQKTLEDLGIKSVVDLGCGDWRLGKEINWTGIRYLGIDVVDLIVSQNVKNFAATNISFLKADGTDFPLPAADLHRSRQ